MGAALEAALVGMLRSLLDQLTSAPGLVVLERAEGIRRK